VLLQILLVQRIYKVEIEKMFDYQAGEKYKITLIMVALAGLMAGAFFTILLSSGSEPSAKARPKAAYMDDPDITGSRAGSSSAYANMDNQNQANAASLADPMNAMNLVQDWLPLAWDLSAGTASESQERAIEYMTPDCANAYRQNVWTPEVAQQINASGIKSTFSASRVAAGNNQPDGSVVITVEGKQVLNIPNKGAKTRSVKLEYLVKNTADGLRIAGISEGGKS
jgi:hypothetical protein